MLRIVTLCSLLGCAVITMRKRLHTWKSYTSYNYNSSYYALADVVNFDEHGLWEYKGIRFSRYGNLKQTVVSLICKSERGLTATELGKMLGIAPRSFLWHVRDIPGIIRERYHGQFLYLSAIDTIHRKQYQKRENHEMTTLGGYSDIPIDSTPILILVDRIKHPNTSIESCVNRLRASGKAITVTEVRSFLQYHGLLKKTPHTI